MNPETNKFEELTETMENEEIGKMKEKFINQLNGETNLLRPDGTPVPKSWTVFKVGELVEIKGYTFKVAYIGESTLLFEPVSPVIDSRPGGWK